MIGIQSDNCSEVIQQEKSTIFILGANNKLIHLQHEKRDQKNFQCIGVYDFTGYFLNNTKWSRSCISKNAITMNEHVYLVNSKNEE